MRYGEDVISRIAHAAQHDDTASALAQAVREGINADLKIALRTPGHRTPTTSAT